MRLIKRYSNRKLYDTVAKSYITLESLASIIEEDEKIQILDNDTGEDITASVLSQLIADRTRKGKEYSPSLFIDLIKKGSGSMYDYARKIGHVIGETAYSVEEEIEYKVKKLLSSEKITSEEKRQFQEELATHRLSYLKKIEEQLESIVDSLLKKANVPTKKEIKNLSLLIQQLSQRIEKLENMESQNQDKEEENKEEISTVSIKKETEEKQIDQNLESHIEKETVENQNKELPQEQILLDVVVITSRISLKDIRKRKAVLSDNFPMKWKIFMNSEEEKKFAKFLIKKKVLTLKDYKDCRGAQIGLKKWGIEKTLDKVIIEKNLLSEKEVNELLREHRGGDEELIPGYRIIEKIGEGAMGEVYKAKDLNYAPQSKDDPQERYVAIKILYSHLGKNKATAKRFLQEARLCIEQLNNKHIVKGYEVGYEVNKDFFFYVMEFIEGSNLRSVLKEKGIFSEPLALKILLQMSDALSHAYKINLIHRDIKPDNIMLTKWGDAKLCDLGLARNWGEEQDLSLTRTGSVMGTPFYISPEAADGLKLDNRSDIYSLGATIYHTIIGHVPFDGPNSGIVLNRHRKEALIPPIELRLDLSVGFSAIIEMMMAKSPKDRYQTPMDLGEDIKKLQNGYAPQALLKLKESYGIVETIRKPKDMRSSVALEAILASDTEEFGISKIDETVSALETVKVKEESSLAVRYQDTVEEYRLVDEDSSNYDSFIHINPYKKQEYHKKQKAALPPFLNASEKYSSSKKKKETKIFMIEAMLIGLIFLLFSALVYLYLNK